MKDFALIEKWKHIAIIHSPLVPPCAFRLCTGVYGGSGRAVISSCGRRRHPIHQRARHSPSTARSHNGPHTDSRRQLSMAARWRRGSWGMSPPNAGMSVCWFVPAPVDSPRLLALKKLKNLEIKSLHCILCVLLLIFLLCIFHMLSLDERKIRFLDDSIVKEEKK